jgi:hypothetical protein
MALESVVARTRSLSERGEVGLWTGLWVGAAGAVLATLITTMLFTNEQIDRRVAQEFLQNYYSRTVTVDGRVQSWNMLTAGFQENKDKLPQGRLGYNDFFAKWRKVRVENVVETSGETNQFAATLTYVSHKGHASQPERRNFHLTCSMLINKAPFIECGPKDIKIDDTSSVNSG